MVAHVDKDWVTFSYRGDSVTPSFSAGNPTVAAIVSEGEGMGIVGGARGFRSVPARRKDELGRSTVPMDTVKRVGCLSIDCERVLLPHFDHA